MEGKDLLIKLDEEGQPPLALLELTDSLLLNHVNDRDLQLRKAALLLQTDSSHNNEGILTICRNHPNDGDFIEILAKLYEKHGDLKKAADYAEKEGIHYWVGNVLSSDHFYDPDPTVCQKWSKMGVLGVEMECAALYTVAADLGKKALSVLTVSDILETDEHLSAKDRQESFDDMVLLALNLA